MIKVQNLTKRYGSYTAIKDVSFKIDSGHIYGLLGANGAGKSTTMNIITGAIAPTSGRVSVCSYDLFTQSEKAKACIGYLPETPPLYTDMTPREYLSFVAEARGFVKDAPSHIEEIAEKTGISHVLDRLIKNLSKGYKQRVGIAQALIGDPQIIILDEPTSGLDPMQIIEIRELISSLSPEHTVIISSHILSEIEEVCDRVIIISDGRVIACGSPDELRQELLGPDTLVIETRASAMQTAEILKSVGITEKVNICETENGTCKAEAEITDSPEIREKIFFAFSSAKKALLTLDIKSPSLEDVFLLATGEEKDVGEDDGENETKSEGALPSIVEFLRKSAKNSNSDDGDDEDGDDDDESYRPLFGRR